MTVCAFSVMFAGTADVHIQDTDLMMLWKASSCTYSLWHGKTGHSAEDVYVMQVAGATPLPTDERAAESAETDVRIGEPALARQNGGEEEQELESLRQLRLSDDFRSGSCRRRRQLFTEHYLGRGAQQSAAG